MDSIPVKTKQGERVGRWKKAPTPCMVIIGFFASIGFQMLSKSSKCSQVSLNLKLNLV